MVMQYITSGTLWVEGNTRIRPVRWLGFGLFAAVTTGLGAIFVGFPFLTSHTAHFTLPLVGEVHFPSAAFFDLGVFAVVVGSTLLILTALAHQSIRVHGQQRRSAASMLPRRPE